MQDIDVHKSRDRTKLSCKIFEFENFYFSIGAQLWLTKQKFSGLDLKVHIDNNIPDSLDKEKLTSLTQSSLNSDSSYQDQEDFQKYIEQIKEEYLENIDKFTDTKILGHIHNFHDIWGNEIENIVNLYKVKYDKKDIF